MQKGDSFSGFNVHNRLAAKSRLIGRFDLAQISQGLENPTDHAASRGS